MALDRYELLRLKTRSEFPRFKVMKRRASWMKPIFWLLRRATGHPYTGFTTTVFSTMYVDDTWDTETSDVRYSILRHEKKHIEQFHRWPLGRWAWPVNHLITALCYVLVLPLLWTLRAAFEREGYTQTLLVQYELEGEFSELQMENNAVWISDIFGGSAYFFMWRRKAAYAWAMDIQRRINAGEVTNDKDRIDEIRAA
jgi:hypothetical protein